MNRSLKIILLLFLAFLLVLIRYFENSLFYDPLISFFKSDYSSTKIPEVNTVSLFANIAFRFIINTIISLLILWVAFNDKGIIKLSSFLYAILFVVLIVAFYFLFFNSETKSFLPLFYVRRFLIQPLFLLILLPAFYFQKKNKKLKSSSSN
ncbi:MAG: exosortase F system-associated protein [Bacteroidetes bacterium]|nr:MAG: exosortase F system-associated protein [Bacteroidota bacterium]